MLSKRLRIGALSVMLSGLMFAGGSTPVVSAQTQDAAVALQRGFRTGYSDGYMAGYRDTIDSVAKSYSRHNDYTKADRAYNKEYGAIEEYRDGYQQGFESGYDTGYERRSFESTLPTGLKRRDAITPGDLVATENTPKDQSYSETTQAPTTTATTTTEDRSSSDRYPQAPVATIIIPRDTELILELQDDLNTQQTREGDRFTAKIVSPSEIAGATVEGRVAKVRQPGRLKRKSEILLSFDRIVINDERWSNFSGVLVEVMPVKGDNVHRVDNEGTAIGKSSFKQDAIKVGGATGAGLAIGAVVGGPVGAAVGAGVGAAFGVGAVVIQRGKHIKLNRNQQIRIKTAYETRIK